MKNMEVGMFLFMEVVGGCFEARVEVAYDVCLSNEVQEVYPQFL